MNNGRPEQRLEGEAETEPAASQASGSEASGSTAPSDESAFERLLNEAATVSSPGLLLAPGTRLCKGRFVIRRRIGEGGMGVVFEALDTRIDAPLAIKTLTRVDADGIYRIKHEFRALAGVTHPRLVPLYELFADGELWFFSMRLIRGVRCDRYLASRGAELRAVLAQLCAGVQAIHDAGLLHRDLKPSNVLVAETQDAPAVVILDFGLTSEASRPGATQSIERGVLAGTPAYMAPEQARGQRATTASDWYAVGVMLFEVLAGQGNRI
jgi:eukaryotic-like serine/threonine-protein kinase